MSQELAEQVKDFAQQIFIGMAAELGPKHWDWNPVATKSLEAAEAFNTVCQQRYTPQSTVPAEAPAVPVGTEPTGPGTPAEAPTAPPPPTTDVPALATQPPLDQAAQEQQQPAPA